MRTALNRVVSAVLLSRPAIVLGEAMRRLHAYQVRLVMNEINGFEAK